MTTLPRCLSAFLVSCLLGPLLACSNSSASAPASSTPPASVPTAKPKFAYTGNQGGIQGGSLSGYSVDPSTGALTPLTGFPLPLGANPDFVTHDPQNRFLMVADISANMLHVFAIDPQTGALQEISPSPYNTMIESSSLAIDPSGTHVYLYRTGANVFYPGVAGNQIDAYNINAAGVLIPVPGAPFPAASGQYLPSLGLAIDAAGKFLYLEDLLHLYAFRIDAASGSLALLQTLPLTYGGGMALDPAGAYLFAADSNSLSAYAIDSATGMLTLAKSSPTATKSGPYTLALSPNGKFAYTVEDNNYLVSYAVASGAFAPVGTLYSGVYGQQIAVDPSASFVYVPQACSNCPGGVYNVVHQYSIGASGALTPLSVPTVAAGVMPWGITVTSQ